MTSGRKGRGKSVEGNKVSGFEFEVSVRGASFDIRILGLERSVSVLRFKQLGGRRKRLAWS